MAFEKKLYYLVSTCHLEKDFLHTFYTMQIEQNVWGIFESEKNQKNEFSWFNGNQLWNPHGIEVRNPLKVEWAYFFRALIDSGMVCQKPFIPTFYSIDFSDLFWPTPPGGQSLVAKYKMFQSKK